MTSLSNAPGEEGVFGAKRVYYEANKITRVRKEEK